MLCTLSTTQTNNAIVIKRHDGDFHTKWYEPWKNHIPKATYQDWKAQKHINVNHIF